MKASIVILIGALSTLNVNAQLNVGGLPISWAKKLPQTPTPEKISLAAPDWEAIHAQDEREERFRNEGLIIPPRFGYPIPASIGPSSSGSWIDLEYGNKLWTLQIESKGALALNILFDHFHLAKNVVAYIYSKDSSQVLGGFTSRNNKGEYEDLRGFGTGLIKGDLINIEIYFPAGTIEQSAFEVSHIVHGYRLIGRHLFAGEGNDPSYGSSGDCQVNVNCSPEGDNWQDEKRGVAMILVDGSRWCTGSLVNNTCNDGALYFLTANHCADGVGKDAIDDSDLDDWSFYWNYESEGCATPTNEPPPNPITNGATLVANNTNTDFALLVLDESPIEAANDMWVAYFNGWSRTNFPEHGGVGIHHPSGDIKKIATHDQIPISNSACPDVADNFWEINAWNSTTNGHGVMEPGSSGSPLFTSNDLIIGQLFGPFWCPDLTCKDANDQQVVYGRISQSWNLSSIAERSLETWLGACGESNELTGGYFHNCPIDLLINYPLYMDQNYWADNTITGSSSINAPSIVNFTAEEEVIMSGGFEVASGAEFTANIWPCESSIENKTNFSSFDVNDDDNKRTNLVSMFPNPTANTVMLMFNAEAQFLTNISVFSMNGNRVFYYEYNFELNRETKIPLNLEHLKAGVYTVICQTSKGKTSSKLVLY